jgi:hypothetical protein
VLPDLLKVYCELLIMNEKKRTRLLDVRSLVNFLNYAICNLSLDIFKTPSLSPCLDNLIFLESFLSLQELIQYFVSWVKSLSERKNVCSFDELSIFSLFMIRVDCNLANSIFDDRYLEKFKGKLFIKDTFFSNHILLNQFLDIFDAAIMRFGDRLKLFIDSSEIYNVDIFDVIRIYGLLLFRNVYTLKVHHEILRLEEKWIEFLIKALNRSKNHLTMNFVHILWNLIIVRGTDGMCAFKAKAKEQLVKSIHYYQFLVTTLSQIPKHRVTSHEISYEQLNEVYEKHKPLFHKVLNKSEITEIEKFLLRYCQNSKPAAEDETFDCDEFKIGLKSSTGEIFGDSTEEICSELFDFSTEPSFDQ